MMCPNKNSTNKSKAISSYILSGINIKRMLHDQTNTDCNISDINIIRVNRRPIFKIKEREKENNNFVSSLPSKSFKIRSYTKKTKEGDKDESEIFEKVQKFRNGRANSNRMDIFNLSRENRGEKDQIEYKIQSKIKQILQREASIKCKISNQVFVKEVCHKSINSLCVNYQQFNSERFREIAYKVNGYFNPVIQTHSSILLIVSVEALHVHSKKIYKSNPPSQQCQSSIKSSWMSDQQIEVLKMFSSKYYPSWQKVRIAFKVNNAQQLSDLKQILDASSISDYYCIFYPIKKYVQPFSLYQIDGLMHQISSVVLLQSKFKLPNQFPIVSSFVKTLFVTTNNDNLVVLSRTVSAVKCFISQTIRQQTSARESLLIVEDIGQESRPVVNDERQLSKQSKSLFVNAQFGLKQETIQINTSHLQARLQFTVSSRELKLNYNNNRNHNQSTCTQKQIKSKRRTLCERQNNYPLTACKNRNNVTPNTNQKWEVERNQQGNIQKMKEKLLLYMKSESISELVRETRNIRRLQVGDKADETQEICSYIRGCRSKTNHQIVSQLVKKNTAIYKQIQLYMTRIASLNTNHSNIQTSAFHSKQYTEQSVEHRGEGVCLAIRAYKIL